jgi:YD repeat-containing protein
MGRLKIWYAQLDSKLLTSTVSRSHLAVTDWHSTALAATFGVVRNTRELLMDPHWTQIVGSTNSSGWQMILDYNKAGSTGSHKVAPQVLDLFVGPKQ